PNSAVARERRVHLRGHMVETAWGRGLMDGLTEFLIRGGPALWVIAALSVSALAIILWKIWRLALAGAWNQPPEAALAAWAAGDLRGADALLQGRRGIRPRIARAAIGLRRDAALSDESAREEMARLGRAELRQVRAGFRALELVAAIAPLVGLFGTVLGMIDAFQALQSAGPRADPGVLAGGIWEALLTTAAGLAVAIPVSMALAWFEGVAETVQSDLEDIATRVFARGPRQFAAPGRAAQ
ncbi:MAG: MotA/TolQ/ExbB proton channel family protein, partial [Pseudomonadota bacterium]